MKNVLAAILLSITFTQSVSLQTRGGTSNLSAEEKVDALFTPWSKGDTPGAAVIVIKNGKIVLKKGYGLADIKTKKPITTDTAFLLGSVTKQFTAMAIMMLAERRKLRYDDPLSRFFPEFPGYGEKVTIRHLLNHTAGFPEFDDLWLESNAIGSDWPRSIHTPPDSFEPTSKDVMKLLAQQKELQFVPGQKWKYSNSGYVILAQIVEKVSAKSYSQFLQENIFEPLGMKRSLLYDETRPKVSNVATSYSLENGVYKDIDYTPLNTIYGEDNIYTTVEDMYRWDQALYSHRLVKASTLKDAFSRGILNDGTATNYGFGWRIGQVLGLDEVSHTGSWLGFRNSIIRFPDQRFTVIVLSNFAQFDNNIIPSKISKIYLADKMAFPVEKKISTDQMREYVGTYEFSPGINGVIVLEGGTLLIRPPGHESIRLLALSKDRFFLEGMEETTILFNRNADNQIISLIVTGGNSARKLP